MTAEHCVISLSWGAVVELPNGKRYKIRRLKYHGVSLTRIWREVPAGGESSMARPQSTGEPCVRRSGLVGDLGKPKPVGERIKEMIG